MNISFTGSINFQGFESMDDITQHLEFKKGIEIEFYHCIPAGLHPDASITIKKK